MLTSRFYVIPIIVVLFPMSVMGGVLFKPWFVGVSTGGYINIMDCMVRNCVVRDYHINAEYGFITHFMVITALFSACYLAKFAYSRGATYYELDSEFYNVHRFFNRAGFFDDLIALFIVRPLFLLSYVVRHDFEGLLTTSLYAALTRLKTALIIKTRVNNYNRPLMFDVIFVMLGVGGILACVAVITLSS